MGNIELEIGALIRGILVELTSKNKSLKNRDNY
jgi:hypothetical protein